jgi:hypothetical protein
MILRMTNTFLELSQLTNRALLQRVDELVRRERRVQAALIANLSELDARRLYVDQGCSSFYVYCVEKLGYSASAAYRRMEAARAARRFPVILERLADGTLNLTTVALLAKHLTAANHRALLEAAAGKSQGEVEAIVARVRGVDAAPQRSTVRVVQIAAPGGSVLRGVAAAESVPPGGPGAAVVPSNGADITKSTSGGGSECAGGAAGAGVATAGVPPSSGVGVAAAAGGAVDTATVLAYRHAITLTAEEQADLERARELLRVRLPNGDPARIIGKALRQLVATLEARKFGAVTKPRAPRMAPAADGRTAPTARITPVRRTAPPPATRTAVTPATRTAPAPAARIAPAPASRTIPAAVRREVAERDAGRCTFVAANGHRCTERGGLEFHHRAPFAKAGPTTPDNLTLLCARHHRSESERAFGPARKFAARFTSAGGSAGSRAVR